MVYKSSGTAAKSTTGASMSKYDVEIDARVAKLEAAVAALQKHEHECDATLDKRLKSLEDKTGTKADDGGPIIV